jgi:nicotinate dehydrogenase subunit A
MASSVALNVNGEAVTVTVDDPAIPLLNVLRENLELRGPGFGCGLGQCGTCMVLLDDEAVLPARLNCRRSEREKS